MVRISCMTRFKSSEEKGVIKTVLMHSDSALEDMRRQQFSARRTFVQSFVYCLYKTVRIVERTVLATQDAAKDRRLFLQVCHALAKVSIANLFT